MALYASGGPFYVDVIADLNYNKKEQMVNSICPFNLEECIFL